MSEATELENIMVRFTGDASEFKAMVKQAQAQVNSFVDDIAAKAEKVHARFNKMGKSLSLGVTAPLTALGGLAVKAGADFESGFAGVRKTVEATEPEFEALRMGFQNMANEVPVAVEQLLKIGEAAGQLGIENKNILAFTKTIAQMAVATNLSAEEGAMQMAKFANITGMSQEKFSNLGSSIVALGNNMQTTEADIMAMSMRLAAAGTAVNLTEPQILAMAASLSSVGIEAEAGGTAFSTMMLEMSKAVATGSDELGYFAEAARMSVTDFQNLFRKDAMGAIVALLRGLNSMNDEKRIQILEKMGVEGARLTNAMLSSAAAVENMAKALDIAESGFEANAALAKEAEERFKTFWSQVDLVKNKVKLLLAEGFEVMEPVLRGLGSAIGSATEWLRGLDKTTKTVLVGLLALAAAVGPILIGVTLMAKVVGLAAAGLVIMKTQTLAAAAALRAYSGASAVAGASTLAFKGGLIATVAVLSYALGKALGDAVFGMNDYNKQLARSKELSAQLATIQADRHSKTMKEAMGIDNLADRQKYLADQLKMAEQNWKGSQVSAKLAEKEVAMFDTGWKNFTGNKVLEQARQGLEEAKESTKVYGDQVKELRAALGDTTKEIEKQELARKQASDAEAAKAAADLTHKIGELSNNLRTQIDTFGQSSAQVELYKLRVEGAKESELAIAEALAYELEWMEKRNEEMEKAKEIQEAGEDFVKGLQEQVNTFHMSAQAAELYRARLRGIGEEHLAEAAALSAKLTKMQKENELMEKGKSLIDQYRTPEKKLADRKKELSDLLKSGAIDIGTYNRALKDAEEQAGKDYTADFSVKGVDAVEAGSAEAVARMMEFQAIANQQKPGTKPPGGSLAGGTPATPAQKLQAMIANRPGQGGQNPLRANADDPTKILEQIAKNTRATAEKQETRLEPANFSG